MRPLRLLSKNELREPEEVPEIPSDQISASQKAVWDKGRREGDDFPISPGSLIDRGYTLPREDSGNLLYIIEADVGRIVGKIQRLPHARQFRTPFSRILDIDDPVLPQFRNKPFQHFVSVMKVLD